MSKNPSSLIGFEATRKASNVIFPKNTNSYFDIGDGTINIFSLRDDKNDYRFDLFIDKNEVYTGFGNFTVSGDIKDTNNVYRNMNVISDASLVVNQMLTCSKGEVNVNGSLSLIRNSVLSIKNNGTVTLHPHSVLVVEEGAQINIEKNSSLIIYGRVDIHIDVLNTLLESPNVILDSAAVLNVDGIEDTDRIFSLTDYTREIRNKYVNVNTQGERNFKGGRIGYIWQGGSPSQPSQIIKLITLFGRVPLGDFRLAILGHPNEIMPQMQLISEILIKKNSVLYISSNLEKDNYYNPELYLGKIINNSKSSGRCIVEGKVIADGKDSLITIDREGQLTIASDGEVHLTNNAIMRCTHNGNTKVLSIEGKLYLDSIDQLVGFHSKNIHIGEKGKIIVLNPATAKRKILLSIPVGIKNSLLYNLFKDRLDKVEFHLNRNGGILIDKYYESYSKEMRDWYGGRRFERAINDKLLVWHEDAFIEFRNDITSWINTNSTLLVLGRVFKSFGSSDKDRLQDVVNRLISVGCNSIKFRFIHGEREKELTLFLDTVKMQAALNDPITRDYVLITNNSGSLFMRNKIGETSIPTIFHDKSLQFKIDKSNRLEFTLPWHRTQQKS